MAPRRGRKTEQHERCGDHSGDVRAGESVCLDACVAQQPQIESADRACAVAGVRIGGQQPRRQCWSEGKQGVTDVGGREHHGPVLVGVPLEMHRVENAGTQRNQGWRRQVFAYSLSSFPVRKLLD